jgi:hypothetical protein
VTTAEGSSPGWSDKLKIMLAATDDVSAAWPPLAGEGGGCRTGGVLRRTAYTAQLNKDAASAPSWDRKLLRLIVFRSSAS